MSSRRLVSATTIFAFLAAIFFVQAVHAADTGETPVYDEAGYTEYVEKTMEKLDKLYLQFCGTCGVSADKAIKARNEYYALSRELMQHMNAKLDNLDPRKGAALSPTEALVNIHALIMLVDMLTETQMQMLADNPQNL